MWGGRRDTGQTIILENSFKKLFNEVKHSIRLLLMMESQTAGLGAEGWEWGVDQAMLARWVWPQVTLNYL